MLITFTPEEMLAFLQWMKALDFQDIQEQLSITFTPEKTQAILQLLPALGFQGTREQLREAMRLYDSIHAKLEEALSKEDHKEISSFLPLHLEP